MGRLLGVLGESWSRPEASWGILEGSWKRFGSSWSPTVDRIIDARVVTSHPGGNYSINFISRRVERHMLRIFSRPTPLRDDASQAFRPSQTIPLREGAGQTFRPNQTTDDSRVRPCVPNRHQSTKLNLRSRNAHIFLDRPPHP